MINAEDLEKIANQLEEWFKYLSDSLAKFYENLVNGKIGETKRAANDFVEAVKWLSAYKKGNEFFEIPEHQKYKALFSQLKAKAIGEHDSFQQKVERELSSLSDPITKEEVEDFKKIICPLLKEEFDKLINEMVVILHALCDFFKSRKEIKIYCVHHPNYEEKFKENPRLQKKLQETEEKIISHIQKHLSGKPLYKDKICDRIKTGTWTGYLHAWVIGERDCRIVFSWDPETKTITFRTFGTHSELGI